MIAYRQPGTVQVTAPRAHPEFRTEPGTLLSLWRGSIAAAPSRRDWMALARRIADREKIAVADLLGRDRKRKYAWPRQELMWRMRHEFQFTLTRIGQLLGGRDHSTIHHGVAKAAARFEQERAA